MPDGSEKDTSQHFVMLFAKHEQDLFRFILTLYPKWSEAEDILQETAAKLWQKHEDYDPERPFMAWACRFAYHQVMNHRKKDKVRRKHFSEHAIELLADEHEAHRPAIDAKRQALQQCLRKLSPKEINLLQKRYEEDITMQALSEEMGRPVNALYKSLQRIRENSITVFQIKFSPLKSRNLSESHRHGNRQSRT